MMRGTFGNRGELFFEIELINDEGLNLPVDAMLDTGFTGFLAINKQDLDALYWTFIGDEPLQTAKGEILFEVYSGKVLLDEQEYEIPVFVGEELT